MTRILVTGAAGYIGGHVVAELVAAGADVVALDRPGAKRLAQEISVELVEADIFDQPESLLRDLGPVDVCLHLAWEAGFVHNAPAHMRRLSDHVRFLDAVAAAGARQIAVLGTMHEVGYHHGVIDDETPTRPRSQYGVAKNALRQSLQISLADSPVVLQWLRCFYIYGDDARNNSIFTKIADAAREGRKVFPFTSGINKYDFIEVGELARQIAAAAMQSDIAGIINCCSGEPVSLADRVEGFIREHGYDVKLKYGAFPDRNYDSPAVWGDATKIQAIMAAHVASR